MTSKKFLFLNKDNDEVALVLELSYSDPVSSALIAGLLSEPKFIEVDINDKSTLGWKWDGSKTVLPEGVIENAI